MSDDVAAFLARQAHQLLRDDITSQRGAEKAIRLIDGVGLKDGKGKVAQKHLAAIEHLGRGGAEIEGQFADRFKIRLLAEVDRKRDDVVAALMDEPVER